MLILLVIVLLLLLDLNLLLVVFLRTLLVFLFQKCAPFSFFLLKVVAALYILREFYGDRFCSVVLFFCSYNY
jgi:hypothetical protein